MGKVRGPFQGVLNIVRFNYPYYLYSILIIALYFAFRSLLNEDLRSLFRLMCFVIIVVNIISLSVSYYIYDLSGLYNFKWLNEFRNDKKYTLINIHSGFDETSGFLKTHFTNSDMIVYDFYDPEKNTEPSIQRARSAYPLYENTQKISVTKIPLKEETADLIVLFMAAHEIRDNNDRITFFKELKRILKISGQIIITEHQRNIANFLAYNIGAFHFFSESNWKNVFDRSGLIIKSEIKNTPFVSTFTLIKNGDPS